MSETELHLARLRRHTSRHAWLYDATRWALLHGRGRLVRRLGVGPGQRALEIGCGTGALLHRLAGRVGPDGRALGIDLCPAMLRRARSRCRGLPQVELREELFGPGSAGDERFDVVLLSYVLTLTPAPDRVLAEAGRALVPGGTLAVVDFRAAGPLGRRVLDRFPLRIDPGARDGLRAHAEEIAYEAHRSWTGLWSWFLWLGRR